MFDDAGDHGGLRKGELLALEWFDIDYEKDGVTVSKSVSAVEGKQMSYSTPYSAFRDVIAHYYADRPVEEQLPATRISVRWPAAWAMHRHRRL